MTVIITLTKQEEKGIKEYLKEVDGNPKPTKFDVQMAIVGELQSLFQSQHSALADYIKAQKS